MDVDPNSLSWAEKLAMMLETGQGQAKALGLALESATTLRRWTCVSTICNRRSPTGTCSRGRKSTR